MRARDIPNLISVGRIILVFPVVWALVEERFGLALVLFAVAGVSDGLDGYLAKRYRWQSRLGGMLDPLADKLLLIATYFSLGWLGALPWWLVGLVLLRDVVIVTGAVVYNFHVEVIQAAPTLLSKINTLLQIVLGLTAVVHVGVLAMPAWVVGGLVAAVAVTTVASGVDYVVTWGTKARRHGHS
ncbi:MAG: CDP-alcohol phosphatidyltransferase family protein [Gammaproteobacteria bacterium]|jgi:cardiolipin synthase